MIRHLFVVCYKIQGGFGVWVPLCKKFQKNFASDKRSPPPDALVCHKMAEGIAGNAQMQTAFRRKSNAQGDSC
jgi:hypothetical protein